MARVIAFANQKGGVGKTTSAVNVAAFLALAGSRTLLIDVDPQGNATTGLGVTKRPRTGTYQLMLADTAPNEALVSLGVEGFDLVPADLSLLRVGEILTRDRARRPRFGAAVGTLAERYDHVVLDCPPSLGALTRQVLACADEVIVPLQCEFYAMEGLSQVVEAIARASERRNPRLRLEGIALTMYDASVQLSRDVEEDVRAHFGDRVYRAVIPRDVRLAEAASHGQSILRYDERARGARGYAELTREVIHHDRSQIGARSGLPDRGERPQRRSRR